MTIQGLVIFFICLVKGSFGLIDTRVYQFYSTLLKFFLLFLIELFLFHLPTLSWLEIELVFIFFNSPSMR